MRKSRASLLPTIWASNFPLWKKAVMTLQICQFAFYTLAALSAVISLTLMAMGVVYLRPSRMLGLAVTCSASARASAISISGQAMLARKDAACFGTSLLLAHRFSRAA